MSTTIVYRGAMPAVYGPVKLTDFVLDLCSLVPEHQKESATVEICTFDDHGMAVAEIEIRVDL